MGNFRNKLIIKFLLYGFLISSISVAFIYKFYFNSLKTAHIEKSIYKIDSINNFLNYKIDSFELQINSIRKSLIFKEYIKDTSKNNIVKELFLTVAQMSNSIMQLRYIDKNGMETIRVDRKYINSNAFIIQEANLQDKKNRYYFKEAMHLKNNDIWYSKIDLNVEKGKIEEPLKPVLRMATPIYHNGIKEGILIVNIFMQNILDEMTSDSLFNIYLIDKEGEFLSHPNNKRNWSKYFNKSYRIRDAFPKNYLKILNNDFHQNSLSVSKVLDFDNKEKLKIIIEPKLYFVQSQLYEHSKELLLTLFGVVLLSFPLAYLFSNKPAQLKEQVDLFNETLESKIKSRTRRLNIANEKFRKLATLDYLTNIPNRRYFFTMGNKLFRNAHDINLFIGVLALDIDYFKRVNDTYGHKTGDKVLIQVAKILEESIRKGDILARVGGEEFAIVLNAVTPEETLHIAEKIRHKIETTPYIKESVHIDLTTSIGITQIQKNDSNLALMFDRADKALYMAKDSGRNCIKRL